MASNRKLWSLVIQGLQTRLKLLHVNKLQYFVITRKFNVTQKKQVLF